VELLARVGMSDAEARVRAYPHHFSGGMRQRAMIAMAVACEPRLIIADEPTTALDVTVQAQILDLLKDLAGRARSALMLITHDLGVVARYANRVIVMYGGEIVESAPVDRIFANPHHPYTEGLLGAMPKVGQERERLQTIPGTVPPPTNWPAGCRFHDRCKYSWDRTERNHPPLFEIEAAWKTDEVRPELAPFKPPAF
jgi:oligopeptide/dipeptide ABC transporter ATP-binding protein